MNSNGKTWFIIGTILMALFCAIFFTVGGVEQTNASWTALAMAIVAYLFLLLTPKIAGAGKSSVSVDIKRPMYAVSAFYFLCSLIVAIVVLAKPVDFSFKMPLIVNIVLLAISIIVMLVLSKANEDTEAKNEVHQQELMFVKESTARLKFLMQKVNDAEVSSKLERTFDLLNCSPVKSAQSVASLEMEIMQQISSLEQYAGNNDKEKTIAICAEICNKVEERNYKLKLNN